MARSALSGYLGYQLPAWKMAGVAIAAAAVDGQPGRQDLLVVVRSWFYDTRPVTRLSKPLRVP